SAPRRGQVNELDSTSASGPVLGALTQPRSPGSENGCERGRYLACSLLASEADRSYHRGMKTSKKPRLLVRPAGAMGRGVFAGRAIGKGELIESCPVIPLSAEDEKRLAGTTLDHYLFAWGRDPEGACLVL